MHLYDKEIKYSEYNSTSFKTMYYYGNNNKYWYMY